MFGLGYHKIHTVYKRDDRGLIVPGKYSRDEFMYLLDNPWRWTEKVDGTNIRLHWQPGEPLAIGGRTDNAQVPATLVHAIDASRLTDDLWRTFRDDASVTIYGEGYGAKIQKGGGNYREDQSIVIFDVRVGDWWLRPPDVTDVCDSLGLAQVPVVSASMTLREAIAAVQAENIDSAWDRVSIEGIVGTPTVDLFDRGGSRIITKLKGSDFARLRREVTAMG